MISNGGYVLLGFANRNSSTVRKDSCSWLSWPSRNTSELTFSSRMISYLNMVQCLDHIPRCFTCNWGLSCRQTVAGTFLLRYKYSDPPRKYFLGSLFMMMKSLSDDLPSGSLWCQFLIILLYFVVSLPLLEHTWQVPQKMMKGI